MKRVLGAPGFVTATGVALVILVTVVGYLLAFDPLRKTIGYCAVLPDSIGLYPGNQVTTRGLPVGTVDRVEPENGSVRVTFTVDAAYPLHGKVTATTVSDTLVADRQLEVLGDNTAPDNWPEKTCITQTFTPKSITQTLGAFADLAGQLNGGGDPAQADRLRDAVRGFDRATSGGGPKLNQLIKDLGSALNRPDATVAHLGAVLDAFASLADSISLNWGDIKVALTQANEGIGFINSVWGETVRIVDSLLVILPWFNTIAHKYGRSILNGLDAAVPKLHLLSAGIGSLQKLLGMLPAVVSAFGQFIDGRTGQVKVGYAAPRVALPRDSAEQVCAALAILRPGECRGADDGLVTMNLIPLVLGSAGAR
ncbi:MlaD family protein [Nocardia sp. NPDC056000]|uniref:MlaD family protein n=1 Tax=Nocardia sp. NPDC056000 TaxID=3345674 RepID=UPI0035D7156F